MKYEVTTACFNVSTGEPVRVEFRTPENAIKEKEGRLTDQDRYFNTQTIDTETNTLFKYCRNAWDIEDGVIAFWNRLNECDPPFFCHNEFERVVIANIKEID